MRLHAFYTQTVEPSDLQLGFTTVLPVCNYNHMLDAFSSLLYIHPFFFCSPLCHGGAVFFGKKKKACLPLSKAGVEPGLCRSCGVLWPGSARDSAPAEVEAAYRSARRTAR